MNKIIYPFLLITIVLIACNSKPAETQTNDKRTAIDAELLEKAKKIFKALPEVAENPENPITDAKVALGKMLFYDTKLSMTGNNSCNSCHNLATYGVDNLALSVGDNGGFGVRNSPTVYNAALHKMQFWDGRAKDVEEQAGGPILNPVEMAMPAEAEVVKRLTTESSYLEMFKTAFPDDKSPISYLNMQKAIGAFERTLMTPSPFDYLLNGNTLAFTAQEQAGLKDFMEVGCITCHTGVSLGGDMFQKFGLNVDYRTLTKSKVDDEGLKAITMKESDKDIFKVCGLRNVAMTAPYFHDGSVADLSEAVRIMAKAELNKDLTEVQVSNIVAFLNTLTGEIPAWALENTPQAAK